MSLHHHQHSHAAHGSNNAAASHVSAEHARLMRLATTAAVCIASLLLITKLAVWWVSDSLAMLSSLTDSLFDILTSTINLIAVRYALKPPDDDHRFGHTAIEDIAGLAQFVFIVGSMVVIVLQSVERIANPEPLSHEFWGIAVSALGVVLTTGLVMFQTIVARKTKSLIVASDRMHYASDIFFNLGVMAAFAFSLLFGFNQADPIFAILIAIIVLYSTREIGVRAFNNLMNREMPDADKVRIIAALSTIESLKGYHNLKTRYLGNKALVQVHIDVDKSLPFSAAHDITETVEHAIEALFDHAEIIVHADPV